MRFHVSEENWDKRLRKKMAKQNRQKTSQKICPKDYITNTNYYNNWTKKHLAEVVKWRDRKSS